tara:strand:- start:996 stop:1634 length:639 start_codon:yes stop_codon:yes gene_type:complete
MKNLFIALFAIMTLPVFAGWSGNVGMYSEYFYRGVSQSNGDSAVQISAQYDHWIDDSNAFYGGVWASSVEYVDNPASQEYDFYAGYKIEVDDFRFDMGVLNYNYDEYYDSVNEAYVKAGYNFIDLSYYKSLEDEALDYGQVDIYVDFIPVVDVYFVYGRYQDGQDFRSIKVSYLFNSEVELGLELISDDLMRLNNEEVEWQDRVVFNLSYRF